jgi:hypothetical protein
VAGLSERTAAGSGKGIESPETSAQFARTRKWARSMAHKHTVRHDGYERWEFKDGSTLTLQANGLLVCA